MEGEIFSFFEEGDFINPSIMYPRHLHLENPWNGL
jgi:hypothetical protein